MATQKIVELSIKERNIQIQEYLKKNPIYLKGNYSDTADKFGTTSEIVRHQARKLRETLQTTGIVEVEDFKITDAVLQRRENGEIKSLKRRLEHFIKEYEGLSDAYDLALNLKTQDTTGIRVPSIEENTSIPNEATAIIQVSDGHFGKIIIPSTVNGLNEYNPSIAETRMETLGENTIKLIRKERHDSVIDNLVIILGGDFIENSQLHEHSEMTTAMSPMEETLFARKLLTKFIKTVCEYGDFRKVMVVCNRGNHPRTTKKMIASVDYRMNYETILYQILKQDFNDSSFSWHIPDSEIAEFSVYGKAMRSFHGHSIKFGGGIGGLTIPLNKYILRMDQINKMYYNFMGHYHNYSFPTSKCTLNGSVCGIDPYAFSLGCEYQPAIQSFQLIDKKRGMTIKAPIFCD